MDAAETSVLIAGVVLIALVLWYFFGAGETVRAAATAGRVQEVQITVKGGYAPDVVVVRAGQPVRLDLYRDEAASCIEQVVFGHFGIERDLPAYRTTAIDFTPQEPGEFTWTCGMNILRGKLIVEDSRARASHRFWRYCWGWAHSSRGTGP